MKTSNHSIYYAAGLSWDFAERIENFGCRKWKGHNNRNPHRCPKFKTWSKSARSAIKNGKVDGINLNNYVS